MAALRAGSEHLALPLVLAVGLLVLVGAIPVLGLTWPFVVLLLLGCALVAAWAVTRLRAERSEHVAAVARWDATEAVLAERLRLARDLHDIVSHGLGMITVRTATAAHLYERTPDEQALLSAIKDVETISRTATVELRRMLDALRDVGDQPALHPTDTLATLPDIIDGARRAGLRVELQQEELGLVSPGAQVVICCVVREGLANSARYAGSTRVEVRLARTRDELEVTVSDDGPDGGWTVRSGAGHGLVGLRERVSSLGGQVTAGPRAQLPGGRTGFRLHATVPEASA